MEDDGVIKQLQLKWARPQSKVRQLNEHWEMMIDERICKLALNYNPQRGRDIGRQKNGYLIP